MHASPRIVLYRQMRHVKNSAPTKSHASVDVSDAINPSLSPVAADDPVVCAEPFDIDPPDVLVAPGMAVPVA